MAQLADNDVVQAILSRLKISPKDLKAQIDEMTPPKEGKGAKGGEVGVSPRVKAALLAAFTASRELGHSYVGPEHLLIGLAEEEEGLAGDLLRRYGLTPQALRQQTVRSKVNDTIFIKREAFHRCLSSASAAGTPDRSPPAGSGSDRHA